MSMNARIKAIGLVATLFSLIAISFYTIVVQLLKSKIPLILQRKGILEKIIGLKNDNKMTQTELIDSYERQASGIASEISGTLE